MRILIVVMLADRRTTDCPGAGRNILAVTTADLMADHTTGDCAQNRRSNRMVTLFGHPLFVVTFDALAIRVGIDAGKFRHGYGRRRQYRPYHRSQFHDRLMIDRMSTRLN